MGKRIKFSSAYNTEHPAVVLPVIHRYRPLGPVQIQSEIRLRPGFGVYKPRFWFIIRK